LTEFSFYRLFKTSFTVDTTIGAVDRNIGDGLCRTLGGECGLRGAIRQSNAIRGPDKVVIPPGVHGLGISGVDEDVAATGDLDIIEPIEMRGSGRDLTTWWRPSDSKMSRGPMMARSEIT
jgi:hypothetical protein